MAYGDQQFRHALRNHLNSFKLALEVCDRADERELPEWMLLIIQTTDEAIALLDANPVTIELPANDDADDR